MRDPASPGKNIKMNAQEKTKVYIHTDKALLQKQGFAERPGAHEDCMRTDGGMNTYEWWYADAALEDGSTVVAVFYTKLLADFDKPMSPTMQTTYTTGDGTQHDFYNTFDMKDCGFAMGGACDVRMGKNYFRGGLDKYEIHMESEKDGFCIDLAITRTTESWRPGWDGLNMYGSDDAAFGWFVAVPQGKVDATIDFKGERKTLGGSGYHDHNWGNIGLPLLCNHWYWARTEIGPYAVICSHAVAARRFDMVESGNFLLFKNGKLVTSRTAAAEEVYLLRSTPHVQPITGKLISNVLLFQHVDGDHSYELTLIRERNILDADLTPHDLRALAHTQGNDLGWHRMVGRAELKVFEKNRLVETQNNNIAVWEMMSFAAPE